VTVVARRLRHRPGLRLHNVAAIARKDIGAKHGLAVTTAARTIIDMAAEASDDLLEGLISEARVLGLLLPGDLEQALGRSRRRPGAARVRALLDREGEPPIMRSRAERRLRALLRQARLPLPLTNVQVEGYNVDALWPQQRLVVEFDGYGAHGHRRAFERDRFKDAALVAAGYRVIRVTWRQLTDQPLVVVANVARALAQPVRGS
jgi:very-short-patch-repair endonuclease